MALELTIGVNVEGSGAKAELAEIEQGIKRVEQAASKSEAPVSRIVQAMTGQSAQIDRVTQSSAALDSTTQRLSTTLTAQQAVTAKQIHSQVMASLGMGEMQARAAALETRIAGVAVAQQAAVRSGLLLGGTWAAAGLAVAGAGIFAATASKEYVLYSGILEDHRTSIDGVKDAWNDLFVLAGAQIVGSGQNFNSWIGFVEAGIRSLTGEIVRAITLTQRLYELSTGGPMAMFRGASTIPTPANARIGLDGELSAYGRMMQSQDNQRIRWEQDRPAFTMPTRGQTFGLLREYDAADAKRERDAEAAVAQAMRRAAQQAKQDAADLAYVQGYGGPGVVLGIPSFSNLQTFGIQPPTPMPSIGVDPLMGGGLGTLLGLGGLGTNVGMPQIPGAPKPGFWGRAFGGSGTTGATSSYLGGALTQTIMGSLMGGGSMAGGIGGLLGGGVSTALGSMAGTALGGALGGLVGSAIPVVGTLIGAAAGKWIGGLFGQSQGRTDLLQANSQIGGLQSGLLSDFGSLGNIRSLDTLMGTDLAGGWGHQNVQGLTAFQSEADRFRERAGEGMNAMIRNAAIAGTEIPASMLPILESLIRMGGLTEENANLLRGLPEAGVPSMQEISQAAAVLGVDVEALGDKVKQIGLTETAEQAAQAWLTLERAGADMGVVAAASAEQMQGYVDQALQYGFTLPDALRPAVEQMHALGLISGNIEQIEWAKPLSESLDDLVLALRDLVAELQGPVKDALTDLNNTEIVIRPKYEDPTGYTGGPDTSTPMAAGGSGMVSKPTLFLVGEAGPEEYAFSGAGRRFGGRRGAGNITINISNPVVRSNRDIDVLTERIARAVLAN